MKTITKALAGTVAAGAMAVTSAAPAFARDRHDKGIDAGEVIAGAVILGGIAAILSSSKRDRNRYDNRRYGNNDRNYRQGGNSRAAVQKCVRAAERYAQRSGYRFADVTQIRDVDRKRNGWRVKGRLVVDGQRGYRNNNRGYNHNVRYDRNDRRGYNRSDSGKFTCNIQRGRVVDVGYSGIRGLR